MKTIHVITNYFYPVVGGIEKSILETYSRLVKDGFEITVHTTRDDYEKKNAFDKSGEKKGIKIKRYKSAWFGFWPKINWDDADIINLHNFNIFPHVLIMLYVFWRKIKFKKNFELILHPHGGYMPKWEEFKGLSALIKRAYHQSLGKWLICLAVDRVRAVTEWEAKKMRTMGAGKRFEVVPAGIDDMAFEKPGHGIKDDFKKKVEKFGRYILLVGKIDRKKNHKTVIKALEKIPKDIKCVIAGKKCDEDYFQELMAEIIAHGLEERVVLLGYVSEQEKYYLISRSWLFVHIPENECYGLAAREAMAAGALMIVSRDSGMEEMKNAIPVDPKSETELVKAINALATISYGEQQARISQSREAMKTNSWDAVSARFKTLYNR
ncbi:glycosyltransferase family 4 protein [Candidatus Parcubacteria bacterium]|nr:glycosyltransferase family 4 protein [Candidatus Parcubacteria bacterium]